MKRILLILLCLVMIGCQVEKRATSEGPVKTVMGQPSWFISSDRVTAALTRQGGHLGPVTFKLAGKEVQPFSVAPWWNEDVSADTPNIARILRGDFLALPFGLNLEPFQGEKHQVHGETANDLWRFEEITETAQATKLHVSMEVKVRPGRVDKWITLPRGQTLIYEKHKISGMQGPMCFGHHAMLKIPNYPDAARYSCSSWIYGQVAVEPVELPENKGYSLLKTGAVFDDLSQVPTIMGDTVDLTSYPRGRGYEDVVALAADPAKKIAWNAVTFPQEGYVWFSLRDPQVLASTMLWLSNGGRYYAPWNGRHVNVLGIEDNTAFYHYGLVDAVSDNSHNQKGIKTYHDFRADEPVDVNCIIGMAEIPSGFERVEDIEFGVGEMTLIASNGKKITVVINLDFLKK